MNQTQPPRVRIKKAVALRYQPQQESAPRVLAKGQGRLAEQILALAQEHGVPIQEDPDLLEVLAHLDLDQEVPPELYLVVTEVLAFVQQANQAFAERLAPPSGPEKALP